MIRHQLMQSLYDTQQLAKILGFEPFSLYLMGGSGCIVDIGYDAKFGRVFKTLAPFDLIDAQMATLATGYQIRARQMKEFDYLKVYTLSPEDIAVSKIGRLSQRDVQDIRQLALICDKDILRVAIDEVMRRTDLTNSVKAVFCDKLEIVRGDLGV